MSNSLKDQYASTPLFGGNATAVEALYEEYLGDPESVPPKSGVDAYWSFSELLKWEPAV